MTLARCLRKTGTVSVVLDSGIQFLDLGFSTRHANMPRDWDCYDTTAGAMWGDIGEYCIVNRDGEPVSPDLAGRASTYSLTRKQVLDFAAGRWLPLPVFRRRDTNSFADGPHNWARIRLVALPREDESGYDYRCVLALDTSVMEVRAGQRYLAPSDDDAGRAFDSVPDVGVIGLFTAQSWVRQWLIESYEQLYTAAYERRTGRRLTRRPDAVELAEEVGGPAEPVLLYMALLDILAVLQVIPTIRLIAGNTGDRIDCDLILDVGNSRTCGLLIESDPDSGADIAKAVKLKIRDLSQPHRVYEEPFESRVEFALAEFGKNDLSVLSGRGNAFEWPTIARVGFEAARLAGERVGNEGTSGMSSPKRYLWSTEPPAQQWRFNAGAVRALDEPFAAQGAIPSLVNDEGVPLHRLALEERAAAFEARYSRSSLFAFAIAEVLLHALSVVNSPGHRLDRENSENPRRLRRLIVTMPSAMPLAERVLLEQRVCEARDLAYLGAGLVQEKADGGGLDWTRAKLREPQVVIQWDEASAAQVVYLYGRIVRHFAGHAPACFAALKKRSAAHSDALRLATLDIGGGTTDLVISGYTCSGRGNSVSIFPKQHFREGFNIAGDNILFRVIRNLVLDPIEEAMQQAGVSSSGALMMMLFGGDRGDMSASQRLRRQQFALQVAYPLALGMLARYESSLDNSEKFDDIVIDSFFDPARRPSDQVLAYVNDAVQRHGGAEFDLRSIPFAVDFAKIEQSIRSDMSDVLGALAEMVWRYDVDILLVSGRPSRLRAINELLLETLPMMVGRIVPMHGFRVGQWYPYQDHHGHISDPKTTAAVGAMLCSLAAGNIESFNFRSDFIKAPESTVRFIGKLDQQDRIPAADVYYANVDLNSEDTDLPPDDSIEFHGIMKIGFRQFANEWWPATQLYSIEYQSDEDSRELHHRTPITVKLKRSQRSGSERLSESLAIDSALDMDQRNVKKRLKMRLQTLTDQNGYWLDSGILLKGA
ncbi:MAG: hypothetical protein GKR94_21455 [Gammaproteobacteria bacterium]|nr:hypothetical protein [Gammaproteobacteria bacterium]